MRLKKSAKKLGITSEFLFAALSIPEIGGYGSTRRTVVASTIPHLRVDRLKDIEGEQKKFLLQNEEILEQWF